MPRIPAPRPPAEPADTDLDETQELAAPAPSTELEPWDGQEDIYWETERGPTYRVLIRRMEPETWPHPVNGRDVNVKGALGELPPGAKGEWVYRTHGGGKFQVCAIENGAYLKGKVRRLFIPGAPLVRDPNLEKANQPGIADPNRPLVADQFQQVGDTVVASTPSAWNNYIQQALATKQLLGNGDSQLVQTLLTALIGVLSKERRESDPTEQMIKTLELVERFKELGNGGGNENPLYSMLGKVVDVMGRQRQPVQVRPSSAQIQAAAAAPALPSPNTSSEPEQVDSLNFMEMAHQAVDSIVTNFFAETPPGDVASMLELVVPIPAPNRAGTLGPWKRQLFNLGRTQVLQQLDGQADPEALGKWLQYFDQVWETFVNPTAVDPGQQAAG